MSRGYFGIGIYHGKTEANIGTLMRSAQCFGAAFIYTIGKRYHRQASDTMNAMGAMPCYHYRTLTELLDNNPIGCRLIGVELDPKARMVGDYCHHQRAIYLLGAEDHGIPPKELARCHEIIQVPDTSRCLNVAVAGSIVMFDRINHFRTRAA
jgi:tRNA G18 (ribose-2'-O)-methylase SpoU